MRIGVPIRTVLPAFGGGYTLLFALVEALCRHDSAHEYTLFCYGDTDQLRAFSRSASRTKFVFPRRPLEKAVAKEPVDFLWYALQPWFRRTNIPYVYTVWDVAYRMYPLFPELSSYSSFWEELQALYALVLPRATRIVTGTETGKREVSTFFGIAPQNISVVPLPCLRPSSRGEARVDDPRASLGIVGPYVFYPAQFWAFKNHVVVLLALRQLLDRYGIRISAVFAGASLERLGQENLPYIQQQAATLGLSEQVFFIGFVSSATVTSLYKHALALVFPTFYGPDNLPPLEAMALGCPVITSRIPGADEQLGSAALFADPTKEAEWADSIALLLRDESLRSMLISRGRERAKAQSSDSYVAQISTIFDELALLRRCWRPGT